jgi:hypothetical protein
MKLKQRRNINTGFGIRFGDYLKGQVETLGSVFKYYYDIPKMRHEKANRN